MKAKPPIRTAGFIATLFKLLPAALLCALFAAVGVIHVTSRVFVVRAGYELSKLEQESQTLTREHERLKLELATLRSPARLERIAKEKLAMGLPPVGSIISASGTKPQARFAPTLEQPSLAPLARRERGH